MLCSTRKVQDKLREHETPSLWLRVTGVMRRLAGHVLSRRDLLGNTLLYAEVN